LLDVQKNYITATDATRKLIFIDKVSEDINRAIEQIDI
jgi:molecular chaperone HscB